MERTFAILVLDDNDIQKARTLVGALMANASGKTIDVFMTHEDNSFNMMHEVTSCSCVVLPKDVSVSQPKARNYINKFYKDQGFSGFLHVVEASTKLLKSPNEFIDSLEKMMDVLDYDVWFNTECDPCNFVYHKYCPRCYVQVDEQKYEGIGTKRIVFTSHSNTQWIAYNMAKATESNLKFDEDFTVSMYYIIEFLARRKAEGRADQLYFMNQYLSVDEEHGVFVSEKKEEKLDPEVMKKEDAIFTAKKLKHSPDVNIDDVMTRFYLKLKQKFA